jgi:hypothetical protein
MRGILTVAITALAVALAAPSAAPAAWYWSETLAESALETDYAGINLAYCFGRGDWTRLDSGLRGYRRFRCSAQLVDGSTDTGRFFVRGRSRYDFYWDS